MMEMTSLRMMEMMTLRMMRMTLRIVIVMGMRILWRKMILISVMMAKMTLMKRVS
jgi:hypothetical protein